MKNGTLKFKMLNLFLHFILTERTIWKRTNSLQHKFYEKKPTTLSKFVFKTIMVFQKFQ